MKLIGNKSQNASVAEEKPEQTKESQKEKTKTKAKGLQVGKYQVSDGKLRFFAAKGFGKKKWVLVREIPVIAIAHVESDGNQLSLIVNGTAEWFFSKDETGAFNSLMEQLNAQPVEDAPPQQEESQSQQENPKSDQPQQEEAQPQMEPPQLPAETQQPTQESTSQTQPAQVQQERPSIQEPTHQPELQPQEQTQKKTEEPKGKIESRKVVKYEVSESRIKLFATNGFFTKKWVLIRDIPVLEIEKIESEANKLTVTWKGTSESFYTNKETVSFKTLVDQVGRTIEERQKNKDHAKTNNKNAMRKTELLAVINKSVDIVDQSFNLLVDLQDKRINWQQIESYAGGFSDKLNFNGQTLPPLSLDYTKIGSAAKTQIARDASKEVFDVLKATYDYFDLLKPEEDNKQDPLNFQTAKTLISAYFMLNDLLLGRFVGDKNNAREISELEAALQSLVGVGFKVDVEALSGSIGVEGEKGTIIEDCRAIFREQLKRIPDLAYKTENNLILPSEDLEAHV